MVQYISTKYNSLEKTILVLKNMSVMHNEIVAATEFALEVILRYFICINFKRFA